MSTINELKDEMAISTGKLIGLSIVSVGLYFLYYLSKNQDKFDKAVGKEILSGKLFLSYIITWGLSDYFTAVGMTTWSSLLNFVSGVLIIVLAFKAKTALEEFSGKKMNPFATFFFTFFYINYFLNNHDNAASVSNAPTNVEQIEKLADMLQKGIITQDEFDAKKKELLDLK